MAQEIVIHVWCDSCITRETRAEALTYSVGLNGVMLDLDLCDECYKTLVMPLQVLWDDAGRPPKDTSSVPESNYIGRGRPRTKPYSRTAITCPVCKDGRLRERYNLRRHLVVGHGKSVTETMRLLGYTHDPLICPECGEEAMTQSGLGLHRHRAHGIMSPTRR